MAKRLRKNLTVLSITFSAFISITASANNNASIEGCPPPKPTLNATERAALTTARIKKLYGNTEVGKKRKEALFQQSNKNKEKALLILTDALKLPGINAYARSTIYRDQGEIYYDMGRVDETIVTFEKALMANGFEGRQKRRLEDDFVTLKTKGKIIKPKIIIRDKDTWPIIKIPPVTPKNAKRSGYCLITHDVTTRGDTTNINVTSCTERKFKRPAIASVKKWKYAPKITNGRYVIRKGVETKVEFTVKDKCGVIIPEKGA